MPYYDFKCLRCGAVEEIVAGPDDLQAVCLICFGLMVRQGDTWGPWWEEKIREEIDEWITP